MLTIVEVATLCTDGLGSFNPFLSYLIKRVQLSSQNNQAANYTYFPIFVLVPVNGVQGSRNLETVA